MGKPKTPDIPDPARRPERKETVSPDDVQIGAIEEENELYKKGRKALRRPSADTSSGAGGVGLSV